jgi:isoamylase
VEAAVAGVADAARSPAGSRFPLGATARDGGANLVMASAVADAITLCLVDDTGTETQIPLPHERR